jgi:signal transduction histidine kinase
VILVLLPVPLDLLPLVLVTVVGGVLGLRAAVRAASRDRARQFATSPLSSGSAFTPFQPPFSSGLLDIETEARGVLRLLDGLAARQRVRLEIAIQPNLEVRADPRGFRQVLTDLVANAIGHAPGGKVLLGGKRHGGRIQIAVLDDGNGPDRALQESTLRPTQRIVALQGGTLEIHSHAGRGTMVLLRLPEPPPAPAGHTTRAGDVASATPRDGTSTHTPDSGRADATASAPTQA